MSRSTPPPASSTDRWWRSRWAIVLGSTLGLVVLLVGGAFAVQYATADIPDVDELAVPDPSVVYDAAGDRVATLDPAAIHRNVSLEDLPPHVPQAVMAAEDRDFRDHEGYSVPGIVRAAWANATNGNVVQGASTITQQYVELAVKDVDDSLAGKFREVAIAAKLDDQLEKDRILEMYLNAVPLGRGARGLEAAARTYFGVPASELTINQAATFAGMIAAPTAYDPENNPEAARSRRGYVLRGMVEQGWLDAERASAIAEGPLPELSTDPLVKFGPDAYFLDAVRTAVPELLEDPDLDPFVELAIHTTLDRRMQKEAVWTLDEQLADVDHSGAIVTVDASTGAVRALVGGRDYDQEQFNVATKGRRQPGSSFKPFTLAAFLAQGNSPESEVDAPRTVEVPDANGEAEIGNYTQRGYGEVSVREATRRSINTAYVNIARHVGYGTVADTANALGIQPELPEVPTLTLGAGGVSPLDMASAYATFAANGVHHERHLIRRIETLDGEVLYEHDSDGTQVLDATIAGAVTDVLTDVVERGTGTNAAIDRPVAGKTGTTNDYRDAWFVGYTPRFATAVWVGNRDNTPMDRVTGGSLPARTWSAYMADVVAPAEPMEFTEVDLTLLEEIELDDRDEDRKTETPAPEPSTTTPSESPSPTASPSATPSETASPTTTPTPTPFSSPEPSSSPNDDPEEPVDPLPTEPSEEPSDEPSSSPSPSDEPTSEPSSDPSPSEESTSEPSPSETSEPSPSETSEPEPTSSPSSTSSPTDSSTSSSTSDGSTSDGSTSEPTSSGTSEEDSTSDGSSPEPTSSPSPSSSPSGQG